MKDNFGIKEQYEFALDCCKQAIKDYYYNDFVRQRHQLNNRCISDQEDFDSYLKYSEDECYCSKDKYFTTSLWKAMKTKGGLFKED